MIIDRNLTSQQNLSQIDLAIVVLTAQDNQLETLQPLMPQVLEALGTLQAGQIIQIS